MILLGVYGCVLLRLISTYFLFRMLDAGWAVVYRYRRLHYEPYVRCTESVTVIIILGIIHHIMLSSSFQCYDSPSLFTIAKFDFKFHPSSRAED
jgi:hypothetical protein